MKKLSLFLILTALPLLSFAARLNGEGDFQIWNSYSSLAPVSENVKIDFFDEFRYGKDASFFYFFQLRMHLSWKIKPWLSIEPTYRQLFSRNDITPDLWSTVFNPIAGFVIHHDFYGYKFSSRNWVLLRLVNKNFGKTTWEYRNRFQVITPWTFSPWKITPFFSDEVFFRERFGFFENRFIAGVMTPFHKNLDFVCAYLLRTTKDPNRNFINTNILSLSLLFGF